MVTFWQIFQNFWPLYTIWETLVYIESWQSKILTTIEVLAALSWLEMVRIVDKTSWSRMW